MQTYDDQLSLNRIGSSNAIDGQWFLPFTLHRLRTYTDQQEILVTVTLHGIQPQSPVTRRLLLHWDEGSPVLTNPPVQEHVITEWAACGIAYAILPLYTQFQLIEVAQSGDRFDYWVGDGKVLLGLEVSGVLHGQSARRQRDKVRQLLDNPYGIGGYVCVVHFGEQSIQLSFHAPGGN